MGDYEFRSLSPHDFEMLSRDLLQKPLGVTTRLSRRGTSWRHR
jgi:hypothetical protein